MGNPNALILGNMAPRNIVIPVASSGGSDLGNGQIICDYVGTIVMYETGHAIFNFAASNMGGQAAIGMMSYRATNVNGTWVWNTEKGFTH